MQVTVTCSSNIVPMLHHESWSLREHDLGDHRGAKDEKLKRRTDWVLPRTLAGPGV